MIVQIILYGQTPPAPIFKLKFFTNFLPKEDDFFNYFFSWQIFGGYLFIFYFQIRLKANSAKKQMKSVNDSKIRFTLVTILGQAGRAMFTSFRRRRPSITLLGRSGCVCLTLASKGHPKHIKAGGAAFTSFRRRRVTQNTFRPVRLRLPHSGVDGHQDHIWDGRAVSISLRCRRVTQNSFRLVGLFLPHSGVESHQ
jgi:hypothetical protein